MYLIFQATPSGEPILTDRAASTSGVSTGSIGNTSIQSRPSSSNLVVTNKSITNIQEDEVDQQLAKLDGKIEKQRDPKLQVYFNLSLL